MGRPWYVQLTFECDGCPWQLLDDQAQIRATLLAVARACELRVICQSIRRFAPQGITGYLLLGESHLSIHTWPEKGFALVDLVSCSQVDARLILQCLESMLAPRSTVLVVPGARTRSDRRRRKKIWPERQGQALTIGDVSSSEKPAEANLPQGRIDSNLMHRQLPLPRVKAQPAIVCRHRKA